MPVDNYHLTRVHINDFTNSFHFNCMSNAGGGLHDGNT